MYQHGVKEASMFSEVICFQTVTQQMTCRDSGFVHWKNLKY